MNGAAGHRTQAQLYYLLAALELETSSAQQGIPFCTLSNLTRVGCKAGQIWRVLHFCRECLSNAWTDRWVPYGHHTKLARYLCSLIASDGSGCVNAAAEGCRIDWLLLGFGLSAL